MKRQTQTGETLNKGFEDLKVWQLARRLMLACHDLADRLPPQERYDLVSQIRRSSKSVMANIPSHHPTRNRPCLLSLVSLPTFFLVYFSERSELE